jgi:hypothetical protein
MTFPYYAVAKGQTIGIYKTWAKCSAQVTGYTAAKYKGFQDFNAACRYIQEKNPGWTPEQQQQAQPPQVQQQHTQQQQVHQRQVQQSHGQQQAQQQQPVQQQQLPLFMRAEATYVRKVHDVARELLGSITKAMEAGDFQGIQTATKQAAQLLKDGHENYVRKDSVAQERRTFKVEQRVRKSGRRTLQKRRAEGSRQAGDWIRGRNGGRGKGRR